MFYHNSFLQKIIVLCSLGQDKIEQDIAIHTSVCILCHCANTYGPDCMSSGSFFFLHLLFLGFISSNFLMYYYFPTTDLSVSLPHTLNHVLDLAQLVFRLDNLICICFEVLLQDIYGFKMLHLTRCVAKYSCLCGSDVCVVLCWFTSVAVFSGALGAVLGVGEDVFWDILAVVVWAAV